MLMFGLFFVLYFVNCRFVLTFRLNVLYRMSNGSSPMIPFCFSLFVSFFYWVRGTSLIESIFTNKGQRHETVCKIKMIERVI